MYQKQSEETVATNTVTPKPATLPSVVNGVVVDSAVANRRTVAAMIENSPDARPQTGLTNADVVYEAVTEGGITRFMGIFQQTYPDKAGPIRSARSYFIDWLSEYDSFYIHAGGSPTALSRISEYGIKDYPHNSDSYHREPQAGLASEHTLYVDVSKVFEYGQSKKGWSNTYDVSPWQFKDPSEVQPESTPPITIDFTSASYKVVWSYDSATKKYYREMAGSAHKDKVTGDSISASTVITMTVPRSSNPPYSGTGKESEWTMETLGTGTAVVFLDGTRIDGTWKKASRTEKTRFYDSAGAEIRLNRGKIWIEVVPPTGTVSS